MFIPSVLKLTLSEDTVSDVVIVVAISVVDSTISFFRACVCCKSIRVLNLVFSLSLYQQLCLRLVCGDVRSPSFMC